MNKNDKTDMYSRWIIVFDKIIQYLEENQKEKITPSDKNYSHRMERLHNKLRIPQIVFVIFRTLLKEDATKEYLSHMRTWRKDLVDDYDQATSIDSSEDVDRLNKIIGSIKDRGLKINLKCPNDLLAYKFQVGRYHDKYIGSESEHIFSSSFFMDPSLYGKNHTVYYFSEFWNGTIKYDHDQVYSLNESHIDNLIADSDEEVYRSENMAQSFIYGHSTVCIHNEELFGRINQ
mgnify:CR=1 FL=1|jgi:hypothetical protein